MNSDKVDILGVKVNIINMEEACEEIFSIIKRDKSKAVVVTPNAEMIMRARDNQELADILNNADLSLPDGVGVLLASHLFNINIKERVSGFDLMVELLSEKKERNYSVYFLGAEPGVAEKMVENLKKFPKKTLPSSKVFSSNIKISGFHHGYLNEKSKKEVIKEINEKKPDILFVAMGVPLQEKFIKENMEKLNTKVAITVGGSFDVLAGELKRAPLWMQKIGLEWLFRLIQEPGRLKRMMSLPKFVFLALKKALKFKKVES